MHKIHAEDFITTLTSDERQRAGLYFLSVLTGFSGTPSFGAPRFSFVFVLLEFPDGTEEFRLPLPVGLLVLPEADAGARLEDAADDD